ncbi:MAG: ABC-2 family transporter protein, partial [Anaerolineae bacterium]|nr:ABC-2 family transporter protein [Anaerolineae bacterium]
MRIFWSFARQSFHAAAIFRFEFWLRLVTSFVWMFSAYWLWRVLYTQQPGAFGVSLSQMVTYAGISAVVFMIMRPSTYVAYSIASRVKSGEIVMDILKPLDFHLHTLARSFGEVLFVSLTMGLPMLLAGMLLLQVQLPSTPLQALLFLTSLVLGVGVSFSLNYLLGLLAVFTLDIRNISWAYGAITRFFSGSEVPLWLLPLVLGQIAAQRLRHWGRFELVLEQQVHHRAGSERRLAGEDAEERHAQRVQVR